MLRGGQCCNTTLATINEHDDAKTIQIIVAMLAISVKSDNENEATATAPTVTTLATSVRSDNENESASTVTTVTTPATSVRSDNENEGASTAPAVPTSTTSVRNDNENEDAATAPTIPTRATPVRSDQEIERLYNTAIDIGQEAVLTGDREQLSKHNRYSFYNRSKLHECVNTMLELHFDKDKPYYRLADLLCFKGYSIGFHITIGLST